MPQRRVNKRASKRVIAAVCALAAILALAACGQRDTRTELVVWSWEPSMGTLARDFEKANPDIRITIKNTSGYENLNSAIQDGYGLPDIAQLEYFALPQYAVSSQLLDITDRVDGYDSVYTPGTWASVHLGGRVYGLPMDSGPMAFFYNEDVFRQAGVDATKIRTWDDYYEAAKKLQKIGVYIAADSGDASFYDAMIWLAGGRPFHTSNDGKTVTIDLADDAGTKTFTVFWQKMIDEGLVDTRSTTWSESWKRKLGSGAVASVFAGAWMPSLLLSDVPGGSGLWRVAQMPTADGRPANAENGGSALSVLQSSRKPDAAFRFLDYVCHSRKGIATRVDGGSFPADKDTLNNADFLDKTTVTDERGIAIPYFGGQRYNRVLSEAAETVSTGYQYLPFEVYARNDFSSTVGKAYDWSTAKYKYDQAVARIEAGVVGSNGKPPKLPEHPGKRIALTDGIASWQKDLEEYGFNQGFTIE
ncbi:sugar ABC transporter substrate-binding protein [Bifidobacterium sp. 82T10]|uniref:Sugar ABC transporter substrate-binding protein n=1 Tax=Bifidobacterium miconis TaxID=2834435 RepID=A0ABS6WCW4_9BIFI|nr:sugar ABC transporter substrate-binding protein [Bifidobacterium miconis]MBW3091802.1 sugar ABC transporter substrate-binding protein [Bifidobacterium miconis]